MGLVGSGAPPSCGRAAAPLDPAPAGRFRIASVVPPEHYEGAVARAVERIRAGDFEKIVIAREVAVHAPADHDAAAVLGVLRAAFESCYVFCAGRGDAAFIGASPIRSCWCGARACALPRSRSPASAWCDSDPAAELAETDVKLGALLPVLSG